MELSAAIGEVLAEHGTHAGEIRLSPIPGGASRETWLAEAGEQRWVLRRDPEGSVSLAPRLEEHVRRKLEIARPGYDEH